MEKWERYTTYKPDDIPAEIEIPLTLYYNIAGYGAGRIDGMVSDCYNGDKDCVVVARTTCRVKLGDTFNIRLAAIASLRETRNEIQAKAWADIAEVDKRIEALQMLEHKPKEEDVPPWEEVEESIANKEDF